MIEVDGPSLLAGTEIGTLPVEVYAYALRRNGSVGDFFAQALSLDLSDSKVALTEAGLRFVGHLHLPTDDYRLRVLVRNSHTGALGLASSDLSIAQAPELLSPPIFSEQDSYWLTAEMQGDYGPPSSTFGSGSGLLEPTSLGRVSAGQPTTIAVMTVAGLTFSSANLSFRDSTGETVGETLDVIPESVSSVDQTIHRMSFEVPNLPAGRYELQVTMTTAGSSPVITAAPFEIR